MNSDVSMETSQTGLIRCK